MAEKKQHKIVSASTGEDITQEAAAKPAKKTVKTASSEPESKGNPTTYRIIAWVFWVLAIAFEVISVLIYSGKIQILNMSTQTTLIIAIVLDLVCVIVGAQFWKKANHIDPISEQNKAKFWLYNNMGVIVCCFAFVPFLILALLNKDADPKLKKLAVIAAAVALLIGGLLSYDWNPVSEEGKQQAINTLSGTTVYWTQYGTKYHTHEDCQYLNRSDVLTAGSIEQAMDTGRCTTLCSACAKKDNLTVGDNGAVSGDLSQAAQQIIQEVAEPAVEPAA